MLTPPLRVMVKMIVRREDTANARPSVRHGGVDPKRSANRCLELRRDDSPQTSARNFVKTERIEWFADAVS